MQQLQISVDDGSPRGYVLAVRRDEADPDGSRYLVCMDEWPVAMVRDRRGAIEVEVVDERRCSRRGLDPERLGAIADLATRTFMGMWGLAVDDPELLEQVRRRPWPGEAPQRGRFARRLRSRSLRG
jgi:hypothetical protein